MSDMLTTFLEARDAREEGKGEDGGKPDKAADDAAAGTEVEDADDPDSAGEEGDGAEGDNAKPADGDGKPDDGKPGTEDVSDDGADGESDDDDPAALKAELEQYKKRFKDTQASWTREHQARLDLEKKMAGLQKKETGDEDWGLESTENSPEAKGLSEELKAVKAELQEARRRESVAAWNAAEAKASQGKADYQDIVYGLFQPEVERNQELLAEFKEKGATPEAAYELGQRLLKEQLGRLPKALREKLATKTEGEPEAPVTQRPDKNRPKKPSTLDDVPGASRTPKADDRQSGSLVGEFLGELRGPSR